MRDVPADYYERLRQAEEEHWWPVGMRRVGASLLGSERLSGDLLDAGCGAGGFLAWAASLGTFAQLAGVDVSEDAVALARSAVPEADIHVAAVHELPFADDAFDVAVLADVLQHLHEDEVSRSLAELRRVLRPAGALLVRTNGGRRARRARADWRLYDRAALAAELESGRFRVERITHANALLSLLGDEPAPPTESSCGIPAPAGALRSAVGRPLLGFEARYLRSPRRSLPYGHTLFAVATPEPA